MREMSIQKKNRSGNLIFEDVVEENLINIEMRKVLYKRVKISNIGGNTQG
jgi:hypothetical protein